MGEKNDSRHFYGDGGSSRVQADDPPNSRLFIVGNKKLTESDYREAFAKFGDIEDVWMVKDRRTGENKGVTYIKYSKTSEAANALEAMNGKILPGTDRHIKVMIASSRNKGSQREENEDEKIHRLFVLVPKTMSETELDSYFRQFGDVDYVNIVRDKESRESKGFAYIKYYKFSHAAKAFEECDRKYKAVFSEPRKPNMNRSGGGGGGGGNDYGLERISLSNDSGDKCYRLMVIGSPYLTEDQVWKLFNIVPGLEFCQLRIESAKRRSLAMVVYSSQQWAATPAKLHGFEYPTGSRLIVKPDGTVPRLEAGSGGRSLGRSNSVENSNLRHLAETLAQATSIIQSAGLSPGSKGFSMNLGPNDISEICSVALPDPQPLTSIDAETQARCFIVCTPPASVVVGTARHLLSLGNLIEVYMLAHRNCGYAKYASKESAPEAIKTLHGADICGGRIKVLEAEERGDHSRKRLRLDDQ